MLEISCPRRPLPSLEAPLGCTIAVGTMKLKWVEKEQGSQPPTVHLKLLVHLYNNWSQCYKSKLEEYTSKSIPLPSSAFGHYTHVLHCPVRQWCKHPLYSYPPRPISQFVSSPFHPFRTALADLLYRAYWEFFFRYIFAVPPRDYVWAQWKAWEKKGKLEVPISSLGIIRERGDKLEKIRKEDQW